MIRPYFFFSLKIQKDKFTHSQLLIMLCGNLEHDAHVWSKKGLIEKIPSHIELDPDLMKSRILSRFVIRIQSRLDTDSTMIWIHRAKKSEPGNNYYKTTLIFFIASIFSSIFPSTFLHNHSFHVLFRQKLPLSSMCDFQKHISKCSEGRFFYLSIRNKK